MMRLAWPLPPEYKRISLGFGEKPAFDPEYYAQWGYPSHPAMDIPCPIGTETYATHDGWTEPQGNEVLGEHIRVHTHDGVVMTRHSHLSKIEVAFGQHVHEGERIGLTGATGKVTGPHLDYALQIAGVANPEFKGWLDPEPYLREEMMSKLNPHFQQIPVWAKPLWANCRNEWYKTVIPPIGDPFPGKKGIGRPWIGGDGVEHEYIQDGAAGAERYFARLRDFYVARPYVYAWEAPNEPQPMGDAAFRAKLNQFTVRWIELMHGIGKRTVALCLSVGWPDQPGHILDFAPALALADYWALHEYSAPMMQSGESWYCLRYRRTVQALRDAGRRVPPLLITECGIDGGVLKSPQGRTGWKTHARDEEDYMGQLAWYDREMCKDEYVKAAFIFTSGPESDWVDFDVNETLTRKLVAHINAGGPLSALPEESASNEFTQQERELGETRFAMLPATMKAANRAGYVWQDEWRFGDFYFCLVYLPDDCKYRVLKLECGTWQVVATIDL